MYISVHGSVWYFKQKPEFKQKNLKRKKKGISFSAYITGNLIMIVFCFFKNIFTRSEQKCREV